VFDAKWKKIAADNKFGR